MESPTHTSPGTGVLKRLTALLLIAPLMPTATAQTTITVNTQSRLQPIDGFGVSQAFGRAAEFRDLLTEDLQTAGLDLLFSTETGAGLSVIRNRIGSGTTSSDSILPTEPAGGPPPIDNGTIPDSDYVFDGDDRGQVWFSQRATQDYGITEIYADAWSAPGFMKTNGDETGGGYLCGTTGHEDECGGEDWRKGYADFLVRYVRFYAEIGIPVTKLGFLNEPDWRTDYSCMLSTAAEAASFIPILYDTLESAGFGNVSITCCDALGWSSAKTFAQGLVDADVEQYLGIMTSHMYGGDPNSEMSATSLNVWQSEGADLDSEWCATWYSSGGLCEGLTWANKIHTGLADAGLSAYLYWEGLEVNQFQASSYLVASDGETVTPSGRLWAFGMWSRFVRPGATRVATTGTVTDTGITAFENADGSVVVVFVNSGGSDQSVDVAFDGFTPSDASAVATDNGRSMEGVNVSVAEGTISVTVPANGMLTITST